MNIEERRQRVKDRMMIYHRIGGSFDLPYGMGKRLAEELNKDFDEPVKPYHIYNDKKVIQERMRKAAEAFNPSLDPEKDLLSEAHSLENAEEVENDE